MEIDNYKEHQLHTAFDKQCSECWKEESAKKDDIAGFRLGRSAGLGYTRGFDDVIEEGQNGSDFNSMGIY